MNIIYWFLLQLFGYSNPHSNPETKPMLIENSAEPDIEENINEPEKRGSVFDLVAWGPEYPPYK